MVLGIIAVLYCLCAFAAFDDLDYTLYSYSGSEQFGFAIGFILIQTILATVGLCLAVSERKKLKMVLILADFGYQLFHLQ